MGLCILLNFAFTGKSCQSIFFKITFTVSHDPEAFKENGRGLFQNASPPTNFPPQYISFLIMSTIQSASLYNAALKPPFSRVPGLHDSAVFSLDFSCIFDHKVSKVIFDMH